MRRHLVFFTLCSVAACVSPELDGLYRVDAQTLDDTCSGDAEPIPIGFDGFAIRERELGGVTLYPVFPCDDDDACAADNDPAWDLVVIEQDLDRVSDTTASSGVNPDTCLLTSVDKVIDANDGGVVLERRLFSVVTAPYDPNTCTTDAAKASRASMQCVEVTQLIARFEGEEPR